jgi:hypothetical protein
VMCEEFSNALSHCVEKCEWVEGRFGDESVSESGVGKRREDQQEL